MTTGLHEARFAAQIVGEDGDVEALRERLDTAIVWLSLISRLQGGSRAPWKTMAKPLMGAWPRRLSVRVTLANAAKASAPC